MPWIRSEADLGEHPKLINLAIKLGVSNAQAVGHLHYLWWWSCRFAKDGSLCQYKPETIAQAARWTEDPIRFLDALVNCGDREHGFLDQDGDGYALHNWKVYQSQTSNARDRQRRHREKIREEQASTNSHVTVTSPSTRDETKRNDNDDDDRSITRRDLSSSSGDARGVTLRHTSVTQPSRKLEDDEKGLAEELADMGFTDSEEVVAKYGYDKVATVLDWYASLEGPVEKPGALVRQAIKSEKLPKIPPMSQYDEENPPPGVPPGTPKKAWKFFRGKLSSVVKS